MNLEGRWEGFVYFERFRQIIEDDTLILEIKRLSPDGKIHAEIQEIFHMDELERVKFRQKERSYEASGIYDEDREILTLRGDMSEQELRKGGGNSIEAEVNPEEYTIEGRYFNPFVEGQEQVFKVWKVRD